MTRPLRIAGVVSLALHLSIAAGVLWFGGRTLPLSDAPDKPVSVELVMVEQKGAGETVIHSPAPPPPEAVPPPNPPNPAPEPREAVLDGEGVADPAAAKPIPPALPQKPAPPPVVATAPPEINIGGTDSDSNAIVTGENVIPASPDKKARNRPPPYPEEAARRGQQGAVDVVIHVSPFGLTAGVDVLRSSGYASLDRAAREAVIEWRFLPAVKDGEPIPFDMPMRFVFSFN
jgi:protein TonB